MREALVTFVRRNRKPPTAAPACGAPGSPAAAAPAAAGAGLDASAAAPPAAPPAARPAAAAAENSPSEPAAAAPDDEQQPPAAARPARWRRRAAAASAAARREADRRQYMAAMRAYFAEVDAFELAVESPSPPGRGRGAAPPRRDAAPAAAPAEPPAAADVAAAAAGDAPAARASLAEYAGPRVRPMSLGLSRRSSAVAFAGAAAAARRSGAAAAGLRASGAPPRHSLLAPGGAARPSLEAAAAADAAGATGALPPLPSPIQESPAAAPEAAAPAAAAGGCVSALAADFGRALAVADDGPSPSPAAPAPLDELLAVCGQTGGAGALPSMDALLGEMGVDARAARKIGEGTFGEAFRAGGVVLKIVPLEGSAPVNGEPQKRAAEVLAEVRVALALSALREGLDGGAGGGAAAGGALPPANCTDGFVATHRVGVCAGGYAPALAAEWRRWDRVFGSENDAPDGLPTAGQLWVVFACADGGADLEHFEVRAFEELRSILLQAALALAVAEEAAAFEHRDLHWGNLLVRRCGAGERVAARLRGVDVSVPTAGVRVTLIDFTLSRLALPGGGGGGGGGSPCSSGGPSGAGSGPPPASAPAPAAAPPPPRVAYCDLEADPELFAGPRGDAQAETYRRMRRAVGADWAAYCPATNALWLAYLADVGAAHKLAGAAGAAPAARGALRAFRRRAAAATSAAELVWDEFFAAGGLAAA